MVGTFKLKKMITSVISIPGWSFWYRWTRANTTLLLEFLYIFDNLSIIIVSFLEWIQNEALYYKNYLQQTQINIFISSLIDQES
jgi:hypothetical protein